MSRVLKALSPFGRSSGAAMRATSRPMNVLLATAVTSCAGGVRAPDRVRPDLAARSAAALGAIARPAVMVRAGKIQPVLHFAEASSGKIVRPQFAIPLNGGSLVSFIRPVPSTLIV